MYLHYQIDWRRRGYHTPSLYNDVPAEVQDLGEEWAALQRHFGAARRGNFGSLSELIELTYTTSSSMMRQLFLYILADAGPRATLKRLAEHALGAWEPDYGAAVAHALADAGVASLLPDVLTLYDRLFDVEDASTVPMHLSVRLEPSWGEVGKYPLDEAGFDAHFAGLEQAVATLRAGLADPHASLLRGEVYGVRRLAELYLDLLAGDEEERWMWPMFRRMFEAATGIDMSDCYEDRACKPLFTAAKLENFLDSPESHRYEHGARYFWGHRIPD